MQAKSLRVFSAKSLLLAAGVLVASAGSAKADLVIDLSGFYQGGWANMQIAFASGEVVGTLTAISIDAAFSDQVGTTWASDMGVLIGHGTTAPFAAGTGVLQVGGFSNGTGGAPAQFFQSWLGQGNTTANQQITVTNANFNPVVFAGDASDPTILYGNAFNSTASNAQWNGTLTLHGLSLVPAPGAFVLLGLAGLVGPRRRQH